MGDIPGAGLHCSVCVAAVCCSHHAIHVSGLGVLRVGGCVHGSWVPLSRALACLHCNMWLLCRAGIKA